MSLLDDVRLPVRGGPPHSRLLERVALALNSTLDLHEVLHRLAEAGLEASGAAGAAVMLLEGRRLVPAVVVRAVMTDETVHERFAGLGGIELDDDRLALLETGLAIALEDARESDLVPAHVVERFDLRGVALVPLMAGTEACGLLLVDWDEVRTFAEGDMAFLEALGSFAGLAVRNARLFDSTQRRAQLQRAVAEAAAGLASPLEPPVIADRLAEAYTELLGARLCAVGLLDEARGRITAAASRGTPPVARPMPVSEIPTRIVDRLWTEWAQSRHLVTVDDDPWLAGYLGGADAGAGWYVVLPLVVDDHVRGVVVLGLDAATTLDDDERSAAEALAGMAAAAIGRHELLERLDAQVQRLDALYRVAAALNTSGESPVLDVVCAAFEELLGATHCSVNVVDGTDRRLRALAVRGLPWFADRPASVSAVRPDEVAALVERWHTQAAPVVYERLDERAVTEPSVVPPGIAAAVLLPLRYHGEVAGVVVVGLPREGAPEPTTLETAQALADLAAAAVHRSRLADALRSRLRHVEALHRLSDAVAGPGDLGTAVAELTRALGDGVAARFAGVAIDNHEICELVGARAPDAEEQAALAAWRAAQAEGRVLRPRPATAGLLVPIAAPARVMGVLQVLTDTDSLQPGDEDLLVAIGGGCAEVVQRLYLRGELARHERRLAVGEERQRIARDLHDSVGQVLTAIGLRITQYLDDSDGVWRTRLEELLALASQGTEQARQAIYSLLFLQTRRDGLLPSLRELVARFESTTGIAAELVTRGRSERLSVQKEDALFRATHEALMNVKRHAGAAAVSVSVLFRARTVIVRVRDDGTGFPAGGPAGAADGHLGIAALEQLLVGVGGSFRVSNGEGGGAVAEARVPSDRERVTVRRAG